MGACLPAEGATFAARRPKFFNPMFKLSLAKGHDQRVSLVVRPVDFDLVVRPAQPRPGKLFVGSRDNECKAGDFEPLVIRAGDVFRFGSCGRENDPRGTAGRVEFLEAATRSIAGTFRWKVPLGSASVEHSHVEEPGFHIELRLNRRGEVSIKLRRSGAPPAAPYRRGHRPFSLIAYNLHLFEGTALDRITPKNRLLGRAAGLAGLKDQVWRDAERRAAFVRQVLDARPQVVGLSEAWSGLTQRALAAAFRRAGHWASFAFDGESALNKKFMGAGTLLSTVGKLGPCGFSYYRQLRGVDAFSAKGVTWAPVLFEGVWCYVVQTHTQASYAKSQAADDAARRSGMAETLLPALRQILDDLKGPVFLLGDLNVVAGSAEYKEFDRAMHAMGMADAWTVLKRRDPGPTFDPDANELVRHFDPEENQKQRLDYIYYRTDFAAPKQTEVLKWKTDSGLDVSDHYGLRAEFEV